MAEGGSDMDDSRSSSVKSTAVVKYAVLETPAQFVQLQKKTNLNDPPKKWLRSDSSFERYIHNIGTAQGNKRQSQFSSFDMAHGFPDLVDELDVITDAQNIKKLLKIRYNKGPVSMMVHRIGKTLLLDEFDIHEHLLRKQQDDWTWLRTFYYETVMRNMQDKEKVCVERKNKSRDFLQNRNMFSKFLYYSVEGGQTAQGADGSFIHEPPSYEDLSSASTKIDPLPEPHRSEFARTVLWTFEDIRMLIGTDLPIFGGGTHPCVSLRLRDAAKPINILTGIDYWLDNLMCNVPELAMCYHLNGIVQSYEVIDTEEIPNLNNSTFSPFVIRDVAQNILSFLKSNATKEGHTYWLFKGTDSDVVKLYDLTTLCADLMADRYQNPFTVPVGLLLFRVAQNMSSEGQKKQNIIRILLKNCLEILDREAHSKIVTTANYMLSDLYVADDVYDLSALAQDRSEWSKKQEEEDDEKEEEENVDENDLNLSLEMEPSSSVDIELLSKPREVKKGKSEYDRFPSITSNVEDRCREALTHVLEGLTCAAHDQEVMIANGNTRHRNPNQPIPMPYEPINKPQSDSSHSAHTDYGPINKPQSDSSHSACTDYGPINKPQSDSSHSAHTDYGPINKPQSDSSHSACTDYGPINKPQSDSSHSAHTDYGPINKPQSDSSHSACTDYGPINKPQSDSSHSACTDYGPINKPQSDSSHSAHTDHGPYHLVPVTTNSNSHSVHEFSVETGSNPFWTWHQKSKVLLLKKAALSYYWLSETKNAMKKYGQALKYVKLALYAFAAVKVVSSQTASECYELEAAILTVAGDIRLMLVHNITSLPSHQEEYVYLADTDEKILNLAKKEVTENTYTWASDFSIDVEQNMRTSLKCYDYTQQCYAGKEMAEEKNQHLLKRLGNVRNELGVFLMNQAMSLAQIKDVSLTHLESLWKQSYDCFEQGITDFEKTRDQTNVALLLSNMGRLMRTCSTSVPYTSGEGDAKREFTQQEKHYLIKAAGKYQDALAVLRQRSKQPDIWDSVCWELSTTYFTMATMMQDYAPLSTHSQEQIEREVTDLMNKSLKYCDTDSNVSRLPMCQYRAATVHHRLASLYHNAFRNQGTEQKKKHLRSLADLHYAKASRFFSLTDSCCESLRVQLERVAMSEFQLLSQSSHQAKSKTLRTALDILLECYTACGVIRGQIGEHHMEDTFKAEADKLINILDSRLKVVLHSMVKLETSSKPKRDVNRSKQSECDHSTLETVKALYKHYLQERPPHWDSSPLDKKCDVMTEMLKKLRGMLDNCKGEG